jgi:hypothetical protein
LAPRDRHVLAKLHVPTSDNPAELDAQLLGLAKILIDSLNDAELDAALAAPVENERSLAKLKRFLEGCRYAYAERDLEVLRSIQSLRSTGAAHARGSNYERMLKKLGLLGSPANVIIERLLEAAITMLDDLAEHARAASGGEGS